MDFKKLTKVVDGSVPVKRYVELCTGRDGYDVDQAGSTFTVGELIERLEGFDEKEPVYFNNDNGYTYGTLRNSVSDVEGEAYSEIVYLETGREGYSVDQISSTLTVGQLAQELRNLYIDDARVYYRNDGGYTYGYIDDDRIREQVVEDEEESTLGAIDEIMDSLADEAEFVWYGGENGRRDSGGRIKYTIEKYDADNEEREALKEFIKQEFAKKGISGVSFGSETNTHFNVYISL